MNSFISSHSSSPNANVIGFYMQELFLFPFSSCLHHIVKLTVFVFWLITHTQTKENTLIFYETSDVEKQKIGQNTGTGAEYIILQCLNLC